MLGQIQEILSEQSESLLGHTCNTISKDSLHLPGPDFIDRVLSLSDRGPTVLRNLQTMYNAGRLGGGAVLVDMRG